MESAALSRLLRRLEPYLLLFILYFIVGRVGLTLSPEQALVTPLWFGSALALSALVLQGWRLWPAVFFGALLLYTSAGSSLFLACVLALAQTVEVVLARYILVYVVGFGPNFTRLRDNLGFVVTALLAPAVSASTAIGALIVTGTVSPNAGIPLWAVWWSASAASISTLGPACVKWLFQPTFKRTPAQYAEFTAALVAVLLTSVFVFWIPNNQFVYYLFIPLTWIALRVGPRGMASALCIAGLVGVAGTVAGRGPYGADGIPTM